MQSKQRRMRGTFACCFPACLTTTQGEMLGISFRLMGTFLSYVLTLNDHNTVKPNKTFALKRTLSILNAGIALQTTVVFDGTTPIKGVGIRTTFSEKTSTFNAATQPLLIPSTTNRSLTIPFWTKLPSAMKPIEMT